MIRVSFGANPHLHKYKQIFRYNMCKLVSSIDKTGLVFTFLCNFDILSDNYP